MVNEMIAKTTLDNERIRNYLNAKVENEVITERSISSSKIVIFA